MSIKNYSDTIGNRTRDLPACSAVHQPNGPPRTPEESRTRLNLGKACSHSVQNLLLSTHPDLFQVKVQLVSKWMMDYIIIFFWIVDFNIDMKWDLVVMISRFDFCLTVHHQLGKVIQK